MDHTVAILPQVPEIKQMKASGKGRLSKANKLGEKNGKESVFFGIFKYLRHCCRNSHVVDPNS